MKSAWKHLFSLMIAGGALVALSACTNGCECQKPAPKVRIVLTGRSNF